MFVKGKSGNPKGKPKGAKHKFTKIREDWLKAYQKAPHAGVAFWMKIKKDDPVEFAKMGVKMLPKDLTLDTGEGKKVIKLTMELGDDGD